MQNKKTIRAFLEMRLVPGLRDLLRDIEEPTTGTRAELIERLLSAPAFKPSNALEGALKPHLVEACEKSGLPADGTKEVLRNRLIAQFKREANEPMRAAPAVRKVQAVPTIVVAPVMQAPQMGANLSPMQQDVFTFLAGFRPSGPLKSEREYELELAGTARGTFGADHVRTQVRMTLGSIDLEIHGIGVEIKAPKDRGEFHGIVGQICQYRTRYGVKLAVVVFSNLMRGQDIRELEGRLKQECAAVYTK